MARKPTSAAREQPEAEAIHAALQRSWWPVAVVADLSSPLQVTLLDRKLVVYAGDDGAVRVASDRCPHRGASLAAGRVAGNAIACGYHGWQWDGASGACVRVPSLADQGAIPPAARLATYPAVDRWGLVWTCLSNSPMASVPDRPWLHDLRWEYLVGGVDVDANLLFVQENFRDVAHFAFVHPETIPVTRTEVEPLQPTRDGFDVSLERTADPPYETANWLAAEPYVVRYEATAPGFIAHRAEFVKAGTAYILHCPSPISLECTRTFFVRGVDSDHAEELGRLMEASARIYEEDAAIVSTCEPRRLGEPLGDQVHTLSDAYSLAFRRAFFDYVAAATTPSSQEPRSGSGHSSASSSD